jgi:hypothetical protein
MTTDPVEFDKYEENGAYHWHLTDRSWTNFDYNPLMEARFEVIVRELKRVEESELDEDDKQRIEGLEDFVKQRFINDIGNFVLLRGSDNIIASDRPLAQKIPRYVNQKDEFTIIYPNRYFTAEHGPIDR